MALSTAQKIATMRGLTAKFDSAVIGTTPFWPNLCTQINSTGADEEYGMLGAVPSMREWLDDRRFKSVRGANYVVPNVEWESSLKVRKVDLDDDRMALYPQKFVDLGTRAARHPDKLLLSDFIVNGESRLCFDGQNFFDTDHQWGDSGVQSNLLTKTVVDADNPTVEEMKQVLNTAFQTMMNYLDDFGELIHDDVVIGMTQSMNLIAYVPWHYRKAAIEAVQAGIVVNNNTNVVITDATVVCSAYSGTANQVDVYRNDVSLRPFIFQAREPLTRQSKDLDDMEFKDAKFMTHGRYNIGYGAWFSAVRTKLTT